MKKIEYRTIDKSTWPRGEWDDEPDKVQWPDTATGLPCLIVRNYGGALCGYVGLPPGHPYHGKGYDDAPYDLVDCHGGLTFAGGCGPGGEKDSVCHVPDKGEPDNVWWLGFDCSHARDVSPAYMGISRMFEEGTYRNIGYVKKHVRRLAKQLARLA